MVFNARNFESKNEIYKNMDEFEKIAQRDKCYIEYYLSADIDGEKELIQKTGTLGKVLSLTQINFAPLYIRMPG
jgi:hypothetical protein